MARKQVTLLAASQWTSEDGVTFIWTPGDHESIMIFPSRDSADAIERYTLTNAYGEVRSPVFVSLDELRTFIAGVDESERSVGRNERS